MSNKKKSNRLIHASSPYLLQHAYNPVEWWEWGDEPFEKAKREDKLVLVSIGYSACHWCHVMERECFEKEDTAAIMNEHFVCIKVDREERPDIDQVYMDALQLLTGQGGWPLNCFTLPDGRPIHGGTYFPKADWERVLKSLSDFYTNRKEEALEFATDLTNGIRKLDLIQPEVNQEQFTYERLQAIIKQWGNNFDQEWGGYNWAPKFPMPNNWELFLQDHFYSKEDVLQRGVHTTLTKMAEGGIYDQVGGGFARYSTDVFWKVPHFEKMLYDNGQLLGLYAKAYQHNKKELYRDVVEQTYQFIQRELTSPEGLFYSALDADSEGVEGKFYIWNRKELTEWLGTDEPLFSLYYSVDAYGNWEHGKNILYRTRDDKELESLTGKGIREIEQTIRKCNEKLLRVRNHRVKPGLDDKIITCWNALMIKGYAEAYEAFGNDDYLRVAEKCVDVLLEKLWVNEKLYRICKDGKISVHGFAEDYAALAEALISLYEAGGNEAYLHRAYELMHTSIKQFYDEGRQLFYFKAADDSPLVVRKIDVSDDVIPSANSMFAKVLFKLGYYFERNDYHEMVDRMLTIIQPRIEKFPTSYSNWMQVLLWKLKGFNQVIICGVEAKKLKREMHGHYLPGTIIMAHQHTSEIPLLKDKPIGQETQIFVCRDKTCGLPVHSVHDALKSFLE